MVGVGMDIKKKAPNHIKMLVALKFLLSSDELYLSQYNYTEYNQQ